MFSFSKINPEHRRNHFFLYKFGQLQTNIQIKSYYMGTNSKEKLKIIHIGADPEFLSPVIFENHLVEIDTMDNVFSVSQWIDLKGLPDAIICERIFPGSNGFDFYEFWVDQFDSEKSIPFIILDDEKNEETVSRALQKGIEVVFVKPISSETLINKILILKQAKPLSNREMVSGMNAFKPFKPSLLKRTFDIVSASIALLLVSPILLIFSIAIRLESRGKVLYISKRVGSGYKVFDFYKLRSMYINADKRLKELAHLTGYSETADNHVKLATNHIHGNYSTMVGDPRITKVGKIIRKLNIDELPQLINVLKGDISLVGNRPLPIYEAELLTTGDWTDRFDSPAGITGPWRVVTRRKLLSMSHEKRNSLHNKYSAIAGRSQYSFWKDIWIIFRTIPVIFK